MKRVLITGGASGIGFAAAQRFSKEGDAVCLFDLNESAVAEAAKSLGANAIGVAGSVSSVADLERAVSAMQDAFGGVDCVITCAGIVKVEPSFNVTAEHFLKTLEVNVLGSFLTAQVAAKVMAENNGGNIVLLGSVYGAGGAPERASYCASKGAVHQLVKSLAVEWGPLGIRVNAVAPTGVRTPMVQALIDSGQYDLAGVTGRAPLGRLAEAEEVADACWFLASDQAKMVTGHILPVDGGWLANGYTLKRS